MHDQTLTGVVISSVLLATLFLLPATVSAQTNTDSGISGLLNQAKVTLSNLAADVGLLDEDEEDKENQDADVNVLTGRESQSPLLESKQEQQADNESNDTDGMVAGTSTQTSAELQAMLDQVQDEVDRLTTQIGIEDPNDTNNSNNASDQTISTDPDGNYVTADQLNSLKQTMYKNVESAVDTIDDTDDDTTYDAGGGLSLSDEDNTFSVIQGSNGIWNTSGSNFYYNGGKVGIGTTSPDSTLAVSGTTTAQAVSVDGDIISDFTGSNLSVTNGVLNASAGGSAGGTDGQIQFNSSGSFAGSSDLYWDDANGRLGIGTSSPDQDLHVSGTSTVSNAIGVGVTSPDVSLDVNGAIEVGDGKATGDKSSIAMGDSYLGTDPEASGIQGSLAIGAGVVASGNKGATAIGFRNEASGNQGATALGANTIATGDDGATALGKSTRAEGDGGATALGKITKASGNDGATALGYYTTAQATSSFAIGTGAGYNNRLTNSTPESLMIGFDSTSPTMFVDSSSVGIGTSSPASTLAVSGTTTAQAVSVNGNQAVSDFAGEDLTNDNGDLEVEASGSAGNIQFKSGSDGSLQGASTVNWDSVNFQFQVTGEITQSDHQSCDLTANGFGDIVCAGSDKKLKTDKKKIGSVLDKLKRIDGYTFRFKEGTGFATSSRQIGFIAQDVREVFPELVGSNGEYLTMDYGNMTAVLTESIKELDKKVESLESETESNQQISADTNASFWKNSHTASSSDTSTDTDTDNKTLTDTFLEAVAEAVGGVVENGQVVFNKLMTDTMVVRNDIEAENVDASDTVSAGEEVCIDGSCITKDELDTLINIHSNRSGEDSSAQEKTDDLPIMDSKEDKQEEEEENNTDDEDTDTDSEDSTDNQDTTSTTTDSQQDDDGGTVAGTSTEEVSDDSADTSTSSSQESENEDNTNDDDEADDEKQNRQTEDQGNEQEGGSDENNQEESKDDDESSEVSSSETDGEKSDSENQDQNNQKDEGEADKDDEADDEGTQN